MHDDITLKVLYDELKDIREEMSKTYVTRHEFSPIKSIVYGAVSLSLVAVGTAIVAQVVKGF